MNEIRSFLKSRSTMNLTLIAVNLLVFLFLEFLGDTENTEFMLQHGACYVPYILGDSKYYLLITSMFLHFGIEHLLNNMLGLIFLGDLLEKNLGSFRYFLIYMLGGLAGNCVSVFSELQKGEFYVSAGASGAVFAVIGALFWMVIKHHGTFGEISGKRLGLLIIFSVFEGFSNTQIDGFAHFGGLIAGFLLCMLLSIRAEKPES